MKVISLKDFHIGEQRETITTINTMTYSKSPEINDNNNNINNNNIIIITIIITTTTTTTTTIMIIVM